MTPLGNELASLLISSPSLRAFLKTLIYCEHGSSWVERRDVYRRHYGGTLAAEHVIAPGGVKPRTAITEGKWTSTACGAYQFLNGTWDGCVAALGVDFSPQGQDIAAAFLVRRRGALADVLAGRIKIAVEKCNKEWASLPGSPYGQPTRTMSQVLTFSIGLSVLPNLCG